MISIKLLMMIANYDDTIFETINYDDILNSNLLGYNIMPG